MDNKINKDDIIIKFNKIVSSIENLSNSINNINIKIVEINKIYMRFEFNKTLELKKTNSYLKLQVDLLNNEKTSLYEKSLINFIFSKLKKKEKKIKEEIEFLNSSHELCFQSNYNYNTQSKFYYSEITF